VTETDAVDDAEPTPDCDVDGERVTTDGELEREAAGEEESESETLSVAETETVAEARVDAETVTDAARVKLARGEPE